MKSPWPGGLHTSGSGEPCWFPAVLQETPTLSGVGVRPRDSVSVPPTRAAVPPLSVVPEVSALPLRPLLMALEAGRPFAGESARFAVSYRCHATVRKVVSNCCCGARSCGHAQRR